MEGEEEAKQSNPRSLIPFTELNQVSSDFILAMTMQEQEQAYTMLETIESDSEEEEEDDDDDDDDQIHDVDDDTSSSDEFYDADFFELLGGENESGSDEEMEEDDDDFGDLDVDELTYEELLALGEFIGEEKRGLPSNEISTCLHPYAYRLSLVDQSKKNSIIDKCVICQFEYEDGEALAALPCQHPYHLECISNWLQIKKCCPICSTEVSSSSSKTKIV
ncbi:hypothetical protein M0R45_011345 [Rubus argutus]|uniref:RING-type domain-containing protein n=1 Tax=Rubus argutus TaxID=59490 RepID=A0AAW1YCR9_RUBAR